MYKELGMQSELHINKMYQSVELLLLVLMLFQPAIPNRLLIFKEKYSYTSLYTFAYLKDHSYIRFILELTNALSYIYQEDGAEYRA